MASNRLTFKTWNKLSHHWLNGLIERVSLIRRSFTAPILVHPSFLPTPPSYHLSSLLRGCSQSPFLTNSHIRIHPLADLEILALNSYAPSPSACPRADTLSRSISDLHEPPSKPMPHDLILLSPFLQWTRDVPGMLAQVYQSLAEDGFFIGCFFGQDTLSEFKHMCANLDIYHHGGLYQRFLPMIHAKDAGALLQRAGFSCPTADIEHLTYHVPHLTNLIHALRDSGFNHNPVTPSLSTSNPSAHPGATPTIPPFLPRTFFTDINMAYQSNYSNAHHSLTVSVDLIFICGWKQTKQTAFEKQSSVKPTLLNHKDNDNA